MSFSVSYDGVMEKKAPCADVIRGERDNLKGKERKRQDKRKIGKRVK
jgi:hypothetical protein